MFAVRFDPMAGIVSHEAKEVETSDSESEIVQDIEMKDNNETNDDNESETGEPTLKRKHESESNSDEDSDSESESESEIESESESEDISANEADDVSASDNEESEVQNERVTIESRDTSIKSTPVDDEYTQSHSSVFQRFKKTMRKNEARKAGDDEEGDDHNDDDDEKENLAVQEVKPMPQPKLPKDKRLYSQSIKNQNLNWLNTPEYHSTVDTLPFDKFEPVSINEKLISNLKNEMGISNAFSVQIQVIDKLLKYSSNHRLNPKPQGDLLVNASTGSGKTLSYLIPIIQTLMGRKVPKLRCIIILPTRVLVTQVYQVVLKLIKGIDLNVSVLRNEGLVDFNKVKPDIIISTPGKLVDQLNSPEGKVDLSSLRYLVVDEADRLLNQSFQNWCDLLINELEGQDKWLNGVNNTHNFANYYKFKCQKLIFSATLTTNSDKLSHLKLFKPEIIVINNKDSIIRSNELYQLPSRLDEFLINLPEALSFYKPLLIFKFLKEFKDFSSAMKGLIFTKSNESCIRLTRLFQLLQEEIPINENLIQFESINSQQKTNERNKILKSYSSDTENNRILISTDLMSRGMNLSNIKHVINYDLPLATKDYVHRIGRTSRGEESGSAISIVNSEEEFKWFKKLVYSGGVINRNDKSITEIELVKDTKEDESGNKNIQVVILLSDLEKSKYQDCLGRLEREVHNK